MTCPTNLKGDAGRRARKRDTDRLRAAWAEGIASGDDGPLDMAKIIDEARQEAAQDR